MRVLFATSFFYPPTTGGEITQRDRAHALAVRGHDVHIWYHRGQPFPKDGFPPVKVVFHPEPDEQQFLAACVCEIRPDVLIVSHLSKYDSAILRKTAPVGMRVVHAPHYWREIMVNPAELDNWLNHSAAPINHRGVRAMKNADLVIANSAYSKDIFARLGIDSVIAEPSVDLERIVTDHLGEYVGFVGLYRHGRIPEELSRALPDDKFLVVDYESADRLKRLRKCPNIVVLPRTSRPANFYCQMRMLLHPSRLCDSYGRIVAEAFINGLPVICSNRGNPPLLVNGVGIVAENDDISTWVDAIKKVDLEYLRYRGQAKVRGVPMREASLNPGKEFADAIERLA